MLDAIDFKIQYFPGFKIVTNTLVSPPFASVLYPCGTERPDDPMFDDLRTGGSGVGCVSPARDAHLSLHCQAMRSCAFAARYCAASPNIAPSVLRTHSHAPQPPGRTPCR